MSKILAFGKTDRPETAEQPLRYTACGLDDVYLLNGFTRETIDGEEYVTIEDLEDLWKAIGLHLVKTRKSLAPKEIKFLRQHMDMTQAELAAHLRVTDQTVARWEKGAVELPGPADLLLRVLFLGSDIARQMAISEEKSREVARAILSVVSYEVAMKVLEKLEEIDAGTSYNDTIALLIRDVTETRGGD